jgi:hypothetical protein
MADFRRKKKFTLDSELELERQLAAMTGDLSQKPILVEASERYALHPVKFFEETFGWGTGHLDESDGLLAWQREVLERLEECLHTEINVIRLAIARGG